MMTITNTPLKNIYTTMSQREIEIFQKLLYQYPESFVKSDLIIYIALSAIWIADVIDQLQLALDNIDVDTADEQSLKLLSFLVGYSWNEALPLNTNRTRIKYYMYRKKYRGTIDSLKNLIKTGYAEEGFFSNRANNSIGIIENSPQIIVTITDNEDTVILRDNIEEVRPAGTVLRFLYRFTLGFIDFTMKEAVAWTLALIRMEPSYFNIDEPIESWYSGPEQSLGSIAGLPILDYNTSLRYLVDMSDYPEIDYRPKEDKDPITTEDYDNLNLLVGKHDFFYKMYVKEHDEYFNYIKPLKDAYQSIEMIESGDTKDGLSDKITADLLALLGNSSLTKDTEVSLDNPHNIIFPKIVKVISSSTGKFDNNSDYVDIALPYNLKAIINTDNDDLKLYDIADFVTKTFTEVVGEIELTEDKFTETISQSTTTPDLSIFILTPKNPKDDNSDKSANICSCNILNGHMNTDNYITRSIENISTTNNTSSMFVGAIKTSHLVDNSLLKISNTTPIKVYYKLNQHKVSSMTNYDTSLKINNTSTTFLFDKSKSINPSKAYIIANWDWSGKFR